MFQHQITRRDVIRAGIGSLPLIAASSAVAGDQASPQPTNGTIPIGIATLGFSNMTNAQLAELLGESDIRIIQLPGEYLEHYGGNSQAAG